MGTSVVVMELLGLLDTLGLEEGRYTVEGANESVGFPIGAKETGIAVGEAIGEYQVRANIFVCIHVVDNLFVISVQLLL